MIKHARYVHTNLIATNWQPLANFYITVFGCEVVPPERHYSGPTLEVFSYSKAADGPTPRVNRPGFGHIAFEVESVVDARAEVLAAGGAPVADVVTLTTSQGRQVTMCYVTDPEGNIIELQSWS